ncbi:MAG: hypothetical protein J6X31_01660 [Bacteroidales bacterium]|nr:hypothetical protein [Bacteroidales bacterium]
MKRDYPMLPQVSPIQKCPSCGKYYYVKDVKKRKGDDYSSEKGNLTYQQLKEAAVQFGESLSKSDRLTLNILLLQTYNDLYNREGVETTEAPEEEKAYIDTVLDELLECKKVDDVVRVEFYRERGLFEDAIALLDKCHTKDGFLIKIVERMKQYARNHKTIAFEI